MHHKLDAIQILDLAACAERLADFVDGHICIATQRAFVHVTVRRADAA